MSITTPQFTGPASGPQQGVGPTPTLFGIGQTGSTVYLYYNGDPNNVIGQGLVGQNGHWEIPITLRNQNPGNANVIAIIAVYGLNHSEWGLDHILYP